VSGAFDLICDWSTPDEISNSPTPPENKDFFLLLED